MVFYEDIVRPICEQLGLTLLQADDLTDAGLPADHFLHLVTDVDVVIAEMAGGNDELSFALGMRHALGRCTVHVTEGTVPLPGAGSVPLVELPSHPAGVATARQQLATVLSDAMGAGGAAASPPIDPSAHNGADTTVHDEEAPGLLDLMAEAEAQLANISDDMADVECALADLAAMSELVMEDMARVSHPGASTSAKLAVVNRLAKAIDGPAGDLEAAAERFAGRMMTAAVAFGAFLEWVVNTPRDEWPDDVAGVLEDVARTSSELQTALADYQQMMALINMFGASSRQLRGPARRIGTSIQTMFRSVAVLEEWRGLAVALKQA
ncbi:hypothetical protein Q3V23_07075 [Streptomyces sp. VNUA116]|uniref:hypothetical protein n=1 Tax=Streptomyces sp. VNUA116 TaxID=3062449 RepID=UPI0026760DA3|nr:hypothetical protein [Streptomyces sp. VNUA116]WKU43867.1 hypothetical protein Q3V23_07075 [Streptomyces sp. VNUA116]